MKILVAGAGGAPSEGVIKSLLLSKKQEEIIGMGSEESDLILSSAVRKYKVPYANTSEYKEKLLKLLNIEKPDFIHFQNDLEIYHASMIREDIHQTGVKTYLPPHDIIDICVHKYKTYEKWHENKLCVPETIIINNMEDLKSAMKTLSDINGNVWLRSTSIGGGGKGAIPVNDIDMARLWIERHNGWGEFSASKMLTKDSVTWLSIWYEGELVVAQTRKRSGWVHGNRAVSGVTGVTKVGITYSNDQVNEIAQNAVYAVTSKPHGIFGVDMTYDEKGIPNPTEINIARFFTTIRFFTEAGLNMPEIYKDIALYNEFPELSKKINPLEDNLMWARAMDREPRLLCISDFEREIIKL